MVIFFWLFEDFLIWLFELNWKIWKKAKFVKKLKNYRQKEEECFKSCRITNQHIKLIFKSKKSFRVKKLKKGLGDWKKE